MRAVFPLSTLFVTLAVVSVGAPSAFAASVLDGLDARARERVARHCLPEQFSGGAAAYRNCVTEAAAGERVLSGSETGLAFAERHAAERVCADGDDGITAECVEARLTALEGRAAPALDALVPAERHALDRECAGAAIDGASAYRDCIARALGELGTLPGVELAALGPLARNRMDARCASEDATAVTYRRCLLEATGVRVERPAEPEPAAAAPAAEAAVDTATEAPAEANGTAPPLGGAEGGTAIAEAPETTAVETPVAEEGDRPGGARNAKIDGSEAEDGRDDGVLGRLGVTVAGLDGTERLLLGLALALPLLLLGGWALARRSRVAVGTEPALAAVAPAPRVRDLEHDDHDDTEELSDTWPDGRFATATHPREIDTELGLPAGPGHRSPGGADAADAGVAPAPFLPRSAFGRWLDAEPASRRLGHVIELLVYWMAYGDERYAPETRLRVLGSDAEALDTHDRIKRHVFEQDIAAFADAVRWLQGEADAEQRAQVLDLLMVLLVEESAMSPVQNTLLRFLADAFGVGAAALDESHRALFGTPMPALPRVDLPAWWEKTTPAQTARWNGEADTVPDEATRCRERLGLPLAGQLDEHEIDDGFARAVRRYDATRFDALGTRERTLVERQREKLADARDYLLGEHA